jgi:hypothetical protein
MIKIASLQAIAGAILACGLAAAPAQAGPNRTFVSGLGTDSGACSRTTPCRTFAFAFTVTTAGGEIDVLDTAGYGPVTILHAISIVNGGAGVAGITASSGNGVTINAGAGDSVHLRGLSIEGLGTGANGILFNTGGNLEIENCVIRNFASAGINISPSTSSSVSVSNTIASDNHVDGISIAPTRVAVVTGALSKVTTNNNNYAGIVVAGTFTLGLPLTVTIVDSEASNNSGFGVVAQSADQYYGDTDVTLRNVNASFNGTGLNLNSGCILLVGHSMVTRNVNGVSKSGGNIFSYGDNDIGGNFVDNWGALTPLAQH